MRLSAAIQATLFACCATIAEGQLPNPGDRDPSGRIYARIVVTITGESGSFGHPVGNLRFLVASESGDRISLRTNDAGVASTWLTPGSYRFVNPDPYPWDGNEYTWDAVVAIRAGTGVIRLSQANASKIAAIVDTAPLRTQGERRESRPVENRALSRDGPTLGKGFNFGIALNGSAFKVDDEDVGQGETQNGGGLSLALGYNFTPNWGILLNGTGANITTDFGDFTLGHGDLLGRFSFAAPGRAFVPYLELGLSGIGVLDSDDDVELSGGGGTGGLGFNYFFKRTIALDINLRYTVGELTTLRVGNVAISDSDGLGVQTARFNIGVAIFP